MANQELGSLREVFTQLCYEQDKTWVHPRSGYNPPQHVMHVYWKLQNRWHPMPKDLPDKMAEEMGANAAKPALFSLSARSLALYLRPPKIDESLLPIVNFELTLSTQGKDSKVILKPRLLLVQCEKQSTSAPSRPHGIGFRFDNQDSEHTYCHSQLCSGLAGPSSDESDLLTLPHWLPQSIPALPIRAKGAMGLLLCLLVSLYGTDDDLIKRIRRLPQVRQALHYIEESG